MLTFRTAIVQARGMDATGIVVPDAIVEELASGKRPKVRVTLNGYTYRSTVAVMGGQYMLPLAKVHREAAGVKPGQKVEIALELDAALREVEIPRDLAAALTRAGLRAAFDKLAFTHRKEHVRAIEEAKAPETRARRIEKALAMVAARAK